MLDLIVDCGLTRAKPTSIPMAKSHKPLSFDGDKLKNLEHYMRLIGRLLYFDFTRLDIGFVKLSQFVTDPCASHWEVALYVLRNLKANPAKGLYFVVQDVTKFETYCDVNWVTFPDTRHSLTGYCVYFGSCLVSWKTKK